jgi:hypothetical protein
MTAFKGELPRGPAAGVVVGLATGVFPVPLLFRFRVVPRLVTGTSDIVYPVVSPVLALPGTDYSSPGVAVGAPLLLVGSAATNATLSHVAPTKPR